MKAKITFMCAVVLSMATVEAGYGVPEPLMFPGAGESRTAANGDPIILASNVEFQRKVETQTTLIQQEAAERRRKMEQRHAEYLERKKQMQKRAR
jgi:hypothetical protein